MEQNLVLKKSEIVLFSIIFIGCFTSRRIRQTKNNRVYNKCGYIIDVAFLFCQAYRIETNSRAEINITSYWLNMWYNIDG